MPSGTLPLARRGLAILATLAALSAHAAPAPSAAPAPRAPPAAPDPVTAALDLLEQGRPAHAEALLARVVAAQPGNGAAWNALGLAHHAQAEWLDAIPAFERAAAILTGDPRVHANLGAALLEVGRLDRARAELRTAAGADATYAKPRLLLGRIAVLQGDAAGAEAAFGESTRLAPDEPLGWYHLGQLLLQQRRATEAVAALERCLKLQPDLPSAHLNLGLALRRVGREREAKEHLLRFQELTRPPLPTPAAAP